MGNADSKTPPDPAMQWIARAFRGLLPAGAPALTLQMFQRGMSDVNVSVSRVLFDAIRRGGDASLSVAPFVEGVAALLRRDDALNARALLAVFSDGRETLTSAEVAILLGACVGSGNVSGLHAGVMGRGEAASQGEVSMATAVAYITTEIPDLFTPLRYELASSLSVWAGETMVEARERANCDLARWPFSELTSTNVPEMIAEGSAQRQQELEELLPAILLGVPAAFAGRRAAQWKVLYDRSEHGSSLNRLKHHVVSYAGPTLTVVREGGGTGVVWVATTNTQWSEGGNGFGSDSGAALLRLLPAQSACDCDRPFAVFVEKSRTATVGVGFGGSAQRRRLWIGESLTDGVELVGAVSRTLVLESVVVVGCGGAAADAAQQTERRRQRQAIERARKVPLPGEWDRNAWDDNADKALLEMLGVKVSHAER